MADILNTPGERMKHRRKFLKLSQAELAALCGWDSHVRIGNYEKNIRKLSMEVAETAAKYLKTTPEWLMFGRGKEEIEIVDHTGLAVQLAVGHIPLIGWDEIASFTQVFDEMGGDQQKIKEKWPLIPMVATVGKRCYGLPIKDDSMVSSHGSTPFILGSFICVDPDKLHKNGSYVVAILSNDEEAVFKKYTKQGEKEYLISLNTAYPTIKITENMSIKGTVVANITLFD